jgi:membrane protein required for colicin V production
MIETLSDLTWIDLIIIAIFLLSIIMAFFRGFVRSIISLITWVAAIGLALTQAEQVAMLLPESMDTFSLPLGDRDYGSSVRISVAFLLIFIGVMVIGGVVNFVFGQIMQAQNLKGIDRGLGMLFGLIRASAIVVILIIMASAFTTLQESSAWQESLLISPFESAAQWTVGKLPEEYRYNFIFLEPIADEDIQI